MKSLFQLTRFYLSLAVAFSALFSYLIIVNTPTLDILIPCFSVLLLAWGTSALNQIQEISFDAKMLRTSNRPLVTKKISVFSAYVISFSLIIFSFFIIKLYLGVYGVYFFLFTLIAYNIIYTYTKRVSYWALILGSFLGVVAPSIGWMSAGASLLDVRFLFLFLLYFVWQVPHFWLLMLMNGQDYQNAGFPTLKDKLGIRGFIKTIVIWYFLTIFIALSLVYSFGVNLVIWIICVVLSAYAINRAYLLLMSQESGRRFFKIRFMELNAFVFLIMLLLSINNLGDF